MWTLLPLRWEQVRKKGLLYGMAFHLYLHSIISYTTPGFIFYKLLSFIKDGKRKFLTLLQYNL